MVWTPFILTFKLALVTTAVLFCISIPLGYWLSSTKSKAKILVEALVGLPLVLPPTVLGFYLLLALSPTSPIGNFLEQTIGWEVAFSFSGLVIGSLVYSLPFMVQPMVAAFESVDKNMIEASYMLGKSPWTTFKKIIIPQSITGILTACGLTIAHTIGEFGVVLMIGGNLPGETKVASIAVFDAVETLNYNTAHEYAIILVLTSFTLLVGLQFLKRKTSFGLWR